jgi:phenylacetate-coenzyme A ligase PaaK-like adenylate-forming protein
MLTFDPGPPLTAVKGLRWDMTLDFLDCCAKLSSLWWTRQGGVPAAQLAKHRLEALVAHARAASPFYRRRFAGLPAGARLADLPPVTKPELMSQFDDWATDREIRREAVERFLATARVGERFLGRYHAWKSSGTTGVPGIFLQDAPALAVYDALVAAQFQAVPWTGERVARMVASGGRAALVTATGEHFAGITSWEHLRRAYPGGAARSFSVMTPTRELVSSLNYFRPAIVAAYPSVLSILAGERRAGRLAIEPALAWSAGEYLAPATRAKIERAFGCPVINEYGASECLSIAHECAHGALHVNADWVLLEGVDERGEPVPPGEISHTTLVTNLANWVQPVIRYDLGDRITRLEAPCACGSALPGIRVDGRRDDIVRLRSPHGTRVKLPPMALATVVEESADVHRFQLVQEAADRLALRIDPGEGRKDAAWKRAQPALRAYLKRQGLDNVRLSLGRGRPQVDRASGKLRAVVVESDD